MMMSLNCIKEKIVSSKNIIISTHSAPDGDAIGSETALAIILKKMNKNVVIVNQDPTPLPLSFLEDHAKFNYPSTAPKTEEALVIIVDVNDLSKIGEQTKEYIDGIKNKDIIFISHHRTKSVENGCSYLINETASSTGEIIYSLIKEELNMDIDIKTAEAIYTAIISDTKSFRYSRTTSYSHRIAAELIELGIDAEKIQSEVFGSNSLGQLKTLGCMLRDIELTKSGKVAYVYIPYSTLNDNEVCAAHTKGFVNHLLTIKGVNIAVLFRESPDKSIKVSIRSKGIHPIEELAMDFGGGGHKFAATFSSTLPKEELVKKITSELEKLVTGK